MTGFAKTLGDLAMNPMQLKPGAGLYVLGGALLGAASLSLMLARGAAAPAPPVPSETTEV